MKTVGWRKVGFDYAFSCLPYNRLKESEKEICDLCGWKSPATFSRKKNGAGLSILEAKAIEEYFAAKGISAWVEEPNLR